QTCALPIYIVEAVEIGAQHLVPILVGKRRKGAVASQAGITDHAIVGAVLLDIGFQLFAAGCAVGDVELQDARLATQRLDLRLYGFGFIATSAAMQDDIVAAAGQAHGDGATDAAAGTGDQNAFTHERVSSR